MASLLTLSDLLINELKEIYFAEKQLVKALPKLHEAATNPDLRIVFRDHLEETRSHVGRLTKALQILGIAPRGKSCLAMVGLVEEELEAIDTDGPAPVRDANIIGAAQRVEHYEMAAYETARSFATTLGEDRVASLLKATLDEEGTVNEKLAAIASTVNSDALRAGSNSPFAPD
jgi:ferritin-like metal-binding protein YciE